MSKWYRAINSEVISEWQTAAVQDLKAYDFGYVPELGDWLQLLPRPQSSDDDGWQRVEVVRGEGNKVGFVPSWFITLACTWCYCPVVVQPPPAQGPSTSAMQLSSPPLHEDFWHGIRNMVLLEALHEKAVSYLNYFDQDMPRHKRTSTLVQHIKFPTPSIDGPFPVEKFAFIDPGEWIAYKVSTLEDMKNDGHHDRVGDYWSQSENMTKLRLFHGTVLGAVLGMIASGGFIPGPGQCRKGSRKLRGAFCSTDFAAAAVS